MELTSVSPATVHPTSGYTHAVRAGGLIFVSGQVPLGQSGQLVGKDNVSAQATQVFANLKAVLESAGSDLSHVMKTTIFVTSADHRAAIVEVRNATFDPLGHHPASTYVVISRLGNPDYLVEIEAIAVSAAGPDV